jgi:predicted RecB family nuclease
MSKDVIGVPGVGISKRKHLAELGITTQRALFEAYEKQDNRISFCKKAVETHLAHLNMVEDLVFLERVPQYVFEIP